MKYCPNAACRYAVKFGRPAEFVDRAVCTECGTLLTSVAPAPRAATSAPVAANSDAGRRLAVTVAAAALVAVALRLPLLGLQRSVFGGEPTLPLKLLAFGLTPFLTGFVVVEVVALLVPALRERRVGNAAARAPLDLASLLFGGVLLALQTQAFVLFVTRDEQLRAALPPAGLLWAQLLGAHAGLVLLARAVSRYGLGNGYAVVALVGMAGGVAEAGRKLLAALETESIAPVSALEQLVVVGGALWVAVRLSRAARPAGGPGPTCAPFPISGLVPVAVAGALIGLPLSLANWVPAVTPLSNWLMGSSLVWTSVTVFLTLDATLLFGWLFFRPRAVGRLWARWVKGVDETGVVVRARSLLPRAMLVAVGALCAVPVLAALLVRAGAPQSLALSELMAVALVGLDLVEEWQARRRLGVLVAVTQVSRMAEVEPVAWLLRAKGIPHHLRSFAWRAALQFFGPYAPVEVLVPADQASAAAAVLEAGGADAAGPKADAA